MQSSPEKAHGAHKAPARFTVAEDAELMKFLIASLPHKSRDNIKSVLRDGQVQVDGKIQKQYNLLLKPGQEVEVFWEKMMEAKAHRGITILYEDDYLIVIDKHAGMLSVATDNEPSGLTAYSMLSQHVKRQDPDEKVFIIHRLDRDTSGLMMYAKDPDIRDQLQADWANAVTERTYVALVEGCPEEAEGVMDSYLWEGHNMKVFSSNDPNRGHRAITRYQVLKTNGQFSLVKLDLETGKKNQIRAHMESLGHPVVGDKKYGAHDNPIGRLGLHAWVLAFAHPVSGRPMRFETNIPRKFLRLI